MSQKVIRGLVTVIAIAGLLAIFSQLVVYVVDQRELAVVKRFGEPVRAATEPGLYFKLPLIETVEKLPSVLQFWGDARSEKLPDLPTKDNKKIEIVPWAVWKINDPIAFVQRMVTIQNAENRVAQFTRGAMRDVITKYDLEDLVRSTDRDMKVAELELDEEQLSLVPELAEGEIGSKPKRVVVGRQQILEAINMEAMRSLKSNRGGDGSVASRGIELVDIGISHIDFVEEVRRSTFERWIAERDTISTLNVKQGELRKQEILNMTRRETEKIQGEGQREASEIRGKADAEIIRRYAEAISEMGEFYTFVRTLEAYKKAFAGDTELVLTTDSDFLRQLNSIGEPQLTRIESLAATQADGTTPVEPVRIEVDTATALEPKTSVDVVEATAEAEVSEEVKVTDTAEASAEEVETEEGTAEDGTAEAKASEELPAEATEATEEPELEAAGL